MSALSPLRHRLTTFERCYAVATQLRRETQVDQFVIRTGMPLQPFRVTARRPADEDMILAWVA
jgi:hypothetical protein